MENKTQSIIIKLDTTREDIISWFKLQKPGLSTNSLRSYSSTIFNLNFDKKNNKRLAQLNLDNTKEIIDLVKKKESKSVKTIFSALNVLTGLHPYKLEMDLENTKINARLLEQAKTNSQDENWISYQTIESIYDEMSDLYWKLLIKYTKNKVPQKDLKRKFSKLKGWLAYLTCSGYYIPPRRNEDYMLMHWDKPLENDDILNYIDWKNKQFIFNVYKTSEYYQQQSVAIPPPLLKWLKTFKKIKKNELVFATDLYYKEYSSQGFGHIFHNFFKELPIEHPAYGKKIGTRNFRQAYLSHLYKDVPKLKDLEQTAHDMGHSVPVALKYYVKQSGISDELIKSTKDIDLDNLDINDNIDPEYLD